MTLDGDAVREANKEAIDLRKPPHVILEDASRLALLADMGWAMVSSTSSSGFAFDCGGTSILYYKGG